LQIGGADGDANRYFDGWIESVTGFDAPLSDCEVISISRDPYQILKPAVPMFAFFGAGGGETAISPSSVSISIAGSAVGFASDIALGPSFGTAAFTGQDVTITQNMLIEPGAATLSIAGNSTAINLTLSPASASISLAGYALTVQNGDRIINVDSASIAMAGSDVDFSAVISMSPALATISMSSYSVGLVQAVNIEPGTATLDINGVTVVVDALFAVSAESEGVISDINTIIIQEIISDVIQ